MKGNVISEFDYIGRLWLGLDGRSIYWLIFGVCGLYGLVLAWKGILRACNRL